MLVKPGDWVIRREKPLDKDTPFTWQPESFGQVVHNSTLYIGNIPYPAVEVSIYAPEMVGKKAPKDSYIHRIWGIGEFDIMGDERLEVEKAKWNSH